MSEEYKIWLAVRTDLHMPAGKLAAQAGHAFAGIALRDHGLSIAWQEYARSGMSKIVVRVPNERSLLRVSVIAKDYSIPVCLIRDVGRTVFTEPTYTVCAFGPWLKSELPPYLKRLQLYED